MSIFHWPSIKNGFPHFKIPGRPGSQKRAPRPKVRKARDLNAWFYLCLTPAADVSPWHHTAKGNSKGSKPTQFAKALSKDSRKWFPALSGWTRVVQRYTAQMHQEMILQSRKSEMPAQVKPHFKFTKDAQQCLIHLGSTWPGSQTETQTLHLLFVFSWLDEDCPQGWKPWQQGSITSGSIIHHTLQDCPKW